MQKPADQMTPDEALATLEHDHDRLKALTSRLSEAAGRRDPDALETELLVLLEFERAHFQREEQVMRAFGYPDHDGHREAHESILQMTAQLCRLLILGEVHSLRPQIASYLATSMDHALEADRPLHDHLQSLTGHRAAG